MSGKGYQISTEVNYYKNGEMNTDTLQFQLFVMCANKVISYKPFYRLPIGQINEYFQVVKFFTIHEVETIITNIISISKTKYEANNLLKRILPSVRCKYKQSKNKYYLSPCCCKDIFEQFSNKTYKLNNGKTFRLSNLFDFESDIIIKVRQSQERFSDPPKFIHNYDIYQLIISNNLSSIYHRKLDREPKKDKNDKTPIKSDENDKNPTKSSKNDTKPTKPDPWITQIHLAVKNNDLKSIQYNIYLIPLLRNAPDKNGKTPVHIAAEFGNYETINLLKQYNADFAIFDNYGNLPCHYLKKLDNIAEFMSAGCEITALNKKGQTILDYNSDPFDDEAIGQLIRLGLISMDEKKVFWAQKILHNHIYAKVINFDLYEERMQNEKKTKDELEYELFQKFIRNNLHCNYVIQNALLGKEINPIINQVFQNINVKQDETIIRNAVNEDNQEIIEFCMKIGIPLDICDENGVTNLMILCAKNDIKNAELFAANYCDPNKVNENGENCFWIAASKEYFEISTMLYEDHQADPNIVSKSGKTLMHIAYESKNKELLYYLLDLGASPNYYDNKRETVQFKAFLNKDKVIAELIQDNFKGNISNKDGNGNTLGHIAIHKNDGSFLEYLIRRKLFIESKDADGRTLFLLAIMKLNDINLFQFILDNGANINTPDNFGNTPFYYVCAERKFNKDKFSFLLKNKCNINLRNNENDFPISRLFHNELYQEVNTLLEMGAYINDYDSPTEPIVISLQKNNREIFEKLVKLGANALNNRFPVVKKYIESDFFDFEILKKMTNYNLTIGTPVQTALEKGKRDVAIFLWKCMSEQEQKNVSKSVNSMHQTILVLSIINNDEYFLQELIKPGFDLTTPDLDGKTPFIHLCSKNMIKWVGIIMPLLSVEEIGVVDKSQSSALTYVCMNNNKQLANELFLKGINVMFITQDQNGIILGYITILTSFALLIGLVKCKLDGVTRELETIQSNIDNCERDMQYNKSQIDYYNTLNQGYSTEQKYLYDKNIEIYRTLEMYKREYDKVKTKEQMYYKNYETIKNATRYDIFYHIQDLAALANA